MMSDLEGAASILAMLEEKAGSGSVTPSEIAAVRCVVESCASDLDDAWSGVWKLPYRLTFIDQID